MNVDFQFQIGDKVLVKEIQRPGTVVALILDQLGKQVRVDYWNDGNRKSEWLPEDEVEPRTKSTH